MRSLSWQTATRIAWREISSSKTKFLFVIFAVAIGVGSLVGVRSFGRAFRTVLLEEARTLMAGDLSVREFGMPDENQQALLHQLVAEGIRYSWITETVSMMSASLESSPVLVSLKAVDPGSYPFYGELKLDPPGRLADRLSVDSVAASEDLLLRLDLKTGDSVNLGGASFRIAGVVVSEPDRMVGSLNIGPRVLMTREALERTGLIRPGSRSAQRHLFFLPPPLRGQVDSVRERLKRGFPNALIADFRETHPLISRGLSRSERFLSLVSLIALIIGALGVAATMHSHLQQRLDSIAILKCLGARSGQVLRIYLLQTATLGLAGGLAGTLIGAAVQAAFPFVLGRYFNLTPGFRWDWQAALEGVTVGVLTALLFAAPVLLSIRRVKPLAVFRRDVEGERKWFRDPAPWIAGGAIIAGLCGIAAWLAGGTWDERARVGGYFAGGLVVSLIVLAAFAWVLLRLLRILVARGGIHWPAPIRHGVANIYRPGNQATAVLVSLGIGVMFTLTVFLVQRGLLSQLLASAPPHMPNVFLINIMAKEKAGIESLLADHSGITQGSPEVVATAVAKLRTVKGTPVEQMDLKGPLRRFQQPRAVTWAAEQRPSANVVSGQWWSARENRENRPGLVCVLEDTARDLHLQPGSALTWTVGLRDIAATVACVYRTEEVRMGGNMDFVFSPGTLDGVPLQYFAAVRMTPSKVAGFQKVSFTRFPSVTVINGADVLEIVQGVVDQIAMVVRFISLFAMLAGTVILASSVASTRFRRVREVAILKTLGATRSRVARIFSVEFLILGAMAGMLGGLLATGFANLLLVRLLDARFRFDPWPNAAAIVLTAIIANTAGWLVSWRILGEKPLEVLRGE